MHARVEAEHVGSEKHGEIINSGGVTKVAQIRLENFGENKNVQSGVLSL